MASLYCSANPSSQPLLFLGFRHPNCRPSAAVNLAIGPNLPSTPLNLRFKYAIRLQVRKNFSAIFASNTNPSDQDSLKEKPEGTETGGAGQGPPFLTILAGIVVFLLLCWIIGFVLLWVFGLILHLLPFK